MTENNDLFLIDSNILVYAFDKNAGTKYEKAKKFVAEKIKEKNAFLSSQNLAELGATITEKVEEPLTAKEVKEIIKDFAVSANMVPYFASTVQSAFEIQQLNQTHFWDALLAATMIENKIYTIFTENTRDFKKIKEIKAINPL